MKVKRILLFFSLIILSIFIIATISNKIRLLNNQLIVKQSAKDQVYPQAATSVTVIKSQNHLTPVAKELVINKQKNWTRVFPKNGIPVLMYHSIRYLPGNTLGVPPAQFSQEMDWLKQRHYETITLNQLEQALLNNGLLPPKPIVLTFDDGYRDNYESAWPIMQKHGFLGVFFVITSSIGDNMMTWDELKALSQYGNSIESHTVSHLNLASLSTVIQKSELEKSKQTIENKLGTTVDALCFPSGRYNSQTLLLMSKLGYKLGFTTHPGNVHKGDNPLTLRRVRISGGLSLISFKKLFP